VGTVIMHSVVSVDGFIADQNDDVGPLHEWYFSGDTRSPREATEGSIIPALEIVSRSQLHPPSTSVRCGMRLA
jgi:hypothetical protein